MPLTDERRKEIMREVTTILNVRPALILRDDEFTSQQYAEEIGLSLSSARRHLRRGIEEGKVEVREAGAIANGVRVNAYSLVGPAG